MCLHLVLVTLVTAHRFEGKRTHIRQLGPTVCDVSMCVYTKGDFTPVDRLLCSETGIKIITMLLFIVGAVRFHTAKFLNKPKLLIQVTCE